jgi:hypothetical protein
VEKRLFFTPNRVLSLDLLNTAPRRRVDIREIATATPRNLSGTAPYHRA